MQPSKRIKLWMTTILLLHWDVQTLRFQRPSSVNTFKRTQLVCSTAYISQMVCRRGRERGPPRPASSQVGHAGAAARVSLGGAGARPAHKHARLTHELLSSFRLSERPNARRNFSTNLL